MEEDEEEGDEIEFSFNESKLPTYRSYTAEAAWPQFDSEELRGILEVVLKKESSTVLKDINMKQIARSASTLLQSETRLFIPFEEDLKDEDLFALSGENIAIMKADEEHMDALPDETMEMSKNTPMDQPKDSLVDQSKEETAVVEPCTVSSVKDLIQLPEGQTGLVQQEKEVAHHNRMTLISPTSQEIEREVNKPRGLSGQPGASTVLEKAVKKSKKEKKEDEGRDFVRKPKKKKKSSSELDKRRSSLKAIEKVGSFLSGKTEIDPALLLRTDPCIMKAILDIAMECAPEDYEDVDKALNCLANPKLSNTQVLETMVRKLERTKMFDGPVYYAIMAFLAQTMEPVDVETMTEGDMDLDNITLDSISRVRLITEEYKRIRDEKKRRRKEESEKGGYLPGTPLTEDVPPEQRELVKLSKTRKEDTGTKKTSLPSITPRGSVGERLTEEGHEDEGEKPLRLPPIHGRVTDAKTYEREEEPWVDSTLVSPEESLEEFETKERGTRRDKEAFTPRKAKQTPQIITRHPKQLPAKTSKETFRGAAPVSEKEKFGPRKPAAMEEDIGETAWTGRISMAEAEETFLLEEMPLWFSSSETSTKEYEEKYIKPKKGPKAAPSTKEDEPEDVEERRLWQQVVKRAVEKDVEVMKSKAHRLAPEKAKDKDSEIMKSEARRPSPETAKEKDGEKIKYGESSFPEKVKDKDSEIMKSESRRPSPEKAKEKDGEKIKYGESPFPEKAGDTFVPLHRRSELLPSEKATDADYKMKDAKVPEAPEIVLPSVTEVSVDRPVETSPTFRAGVSTTSTVSGAPSFTRDKWQGKKMVDFIDENTVKKALGTMRKWIQKLADRQEAEDKPREIPEPSPLSSPSGPPSSSFPSDVTSTSSVETEPSAEKPKPKKRKRRKRRTVTRERPVTVGIERRESVILCPVLSEAQLAIQLLKNQEKRRRSRWHSEFEWDQWERESAFTSETESEKEGQHLESWKGSSIFKSVRFAKSEAAKEEGRRDAEEARPEKETGEKEKGLSLEKKRLEKSVSQKEPGSLEEVKPCRLGDVDIPGLYGDAKPARPHKKEDVNEYLSSHHVHELFQDLISSLLVSQPEQPVDFLIDRVRKISQRTALGLKSF